MAKKNEAKIRFTAETGDLNSAIKKSNDEMSKLRAELKLNETQMKDTGATVEALESKHKILSSQLSVAESKTEALSRKVEKAADIFGENSAEVTKLRTQLLNAQAAEERIRQAVSNCNDELEKQRTAAKKVETASEQLTNAIEDQQGQLDKLKKDYVDAVLQYGEASDEARTLERSIRELSSELKKNKDSLSEAADKADDLDQSLDNADKSAGDAGGGFTVLKGTISDLASEGFQVVIGAIKDFLSYLAELPEATRELRQDFATLTTSFDGMQFSTEEAKQTWIELYAIFGEDDRAVEAANLIAKMSKNSQDLADWITITTGVWATYQDSLPVEGLAEASMETAKTGKVTGVLADALNWSSEAAVMFADYMSEDVTTAEEAFNVALSECTTEEERQALITETLTAIYGDAAETYRDTASAQMDAKEATAEHMITENELAEAIEPVTTMWQELKTELLQGVLPAVQAVSNFIQEHPKLLEYIGVALGVVAAALVALVAIGTAWVISMTWGIMAIIAAITALIVFWDEIVAAVKNACTAVTSALSVAWEWIKSVFSAIGQWVNTNVIQPVVGFFVGLWAKMQEIWNTICNVVQVAFMLIGSIINAAIQIITLPFRFIWENCKEYVFSAFEWIKEKISAASDWISEKVAIVWGWIRDNIVTPIQEVYQKAVEIFNNIKTAISEKITEIRTKAVEKFTALRDKAAEIFNSIKEKIMTPINNAKEKVQNAIQNLREGFVSKINSLKSKVSEIFESIKSKITAPIEKAKDTIKGVVDKIKGFFDNMKLKLPNIKLPHFKVTGKLSIDPPSVPKLSIEWYKDGGIMMRPTIFGMNGNSLMAGGEAGPEAILPIDRLEGYISGAIDKAQNVVNMQSLADAIEDLANRPNIFRIGDREVAIATASANDSVNGLRSSFRSRGLALE